MVTLNFNKTKYILFLSLLFSNFVYASDYKVAVRVIQGIEKAFLQWQATIDYLNLKIPEHKFILLPIVNLDEITKAAARIEYDFLLTNPSSYVEIQLLYNARVLVTLNNKRSDTAQNRFGSVLFTHAKNSDILKINDLQGKTLMAANEHAFGGWRVAWFEMLSQGFNPYKELGNLLFSETLLLPEVVYSAEDIAAKDGKYVGWIKLLDYSSVRKLIMQLKVEPYAVN